MDNNFQGKRSELGVYDDWMHGDDAVEFVMSTKLLHDKITSEQHKNIEDMIKEHLDQPLSNIHLTIQN